METNYPNLRQVLDPAYAGLSDAEIETLFETAFGEGVTPAEYEEFFGGLTKAFGDLGHIVKREAPGLTSIAQGALQGAATGSAVGPWGAIGGALVGGTGAGLRHYGSGTVRDVGNVMGGVVNTAGQVTGRGGMANAAGSLIGLGGQALGGRRPDTGQLLGIGSQLLGQRSPAASQLLSLLGRPEMRQALGSLASGHNPGIPLGAGGTPVPAGALAGLLGALGREAEAESLAGGVGETVPAYLVDGAGRLLVDPRESEQRAARVLQLVRESLEADESWQAWITDSADAEVLDAEGADEYLDEGEWWAA